MRIKACRKAHFNAAHRLYRKDWSDEKNTQIFGKCSNPKFHGHNYDLVVAVTGDVDPETGFLIDLKVLKQYIVEEVEEPFDHKNLNEEVEEFETLNPTAENIAIVIWNRLRQRITDRFDIEVTLYETPRNFVIYSGE